MAPRPAKSRIFASVLLLFVAGSAVGAVRRPQHRLSIQQIQQLEAEWRAAQLSADVGAMDRLLSDDFLGITAAGTVVTKAQQLQRMQSRQFVVSALNVEDTKIKLAGPIAIVTSRAAVQGSTAGEPLAGSFRYTRVYQRGSGGTWKITSFEATRMRRQPLGARLSEPSARGRAVTFPKP